MRLWRLARPRPGRIEGMAAGVIFMPPVMLEGEGILDEGAWISAAFDILSMAEAELRTD